ncbi:MAG: hypothetical protein IJE48_09235 [Clostridia bacterium]|nr:hypothetical protein [Clostridia bacterium]
MRQLFCFGHNKTHSAAHNDCGNASENIRKYICGLLNLCIKLFEGVKLCVFFLGVLCSDFLHDKFFVISVHFDLLLSHFAS